MTSSKLSRGGACSSVGAGSRLHGASCPPLASRHFWRCAENTVAYVLPPTPSLRIPSADQYLNPDLPVQVWQDGQLQRTISLQHTTTFTFSGDGDSEEDFHIADSSVSAPHASLVASSRALFLLDRGSEHGTWVDEEGRTDGSRRGRCLAVETPAETGNHKLFKLRPGLTTFRLGESQPVFRIASSEHCVAQSDSSNCRNSTPSHSLEGGDSEPISSIGNSFTTGVLWQGSVSTFSNSLGTFRRLGDFSSSDVGAVTAELPDALELRFCARASVTEGLKSLVLLAGATVSARQLSELRTFMEAGNKVCHMRTAAGRDIFVVGLREPHGAEPWRLDCRFSKPIDRERQQRKRHAGAAFPGTSGSAWAGWLYLD